MRRPLTVLAFVIPFAACDPTPVDPLAKVDPVPAAQTVSALIGSDGGTLELSSSDGAYFALHVPAGALTDTATVAMSTRDATKEQRFQVEFSPAGLTFAVPATITIELPPDNAVASTGTLLYDGVPLALVPTTEGMMRARLRANAVHRHWLPGAAALDAEHIARADAVHGRDRR